MILHKGKQQGKKWDAVKLGKITATTIASCSLDKDGKLTQASLKHIDDAIMQSNTFQSDKMQQGKQLEKQAIEWYKRQPTHPNKIIDDNIMFIESHDHLGCSPDAVVFANNEINNLVEIKTIFEDTNKTKFNWKPKKSWIRQCMHQIIVSGAGYVDLIMQNEDGSKRKLEIIGKLTHPDIYKEVQIILQQVLEYIQSGENAQKSFVSKIQNYARHDGQHQATTILSYKFIDSHNVQMNIVGHPPHIIKYKLKNGDLVSPADMVKKIESFLNSYNSIVKKELKSIDDEVKNIDLEIERLNEIKGFAIKKQELVKRCIFQNDTHIKDLKT